VKSETSSGQFPAYLNQQQTGLATNRRECRYSAPKSVVGMDRADEQSLALTWTGVMATTDPTLS